MSAQARFNKLNRLQIRWWKKFMNLIQTNTTLCQFWSNLISDRLRCEMFGDYSIPVIIEIAD